MLEAESLARCPLLGASDPAQPYGLENSSPGYKHTFKENFMQGVMTRMVQRTIAVGDLVNLGSRELLWYVSAIDAGGRATLFNEAGEVKPGVERSRLTLQCSMRDGIEDWKEAMTAARRAVWLPEPEPGEWVDAEEMKTGERVQGPVLSLGNHYVTLGEEGSRRDQRQHCYRAGLLRLGAPPEKVVVPIEAIAYIAEGCIATRDGRVLPLSGYVPGR